MKKRKLAEKKVIQSMASFISDVVTYLMNHSSQDEAFHEQIREPVESCLSSLREMMKKVVDKCSSIIVKRFSVLIQISLNGVQEAITACEQTARSWGSLDETPGKYPYRTYKAVCVRQGVFTSRKYGSIDFNEELTEPILTTLQKDWNQVFSYDLHSNLNSFKTSILQKVNKFFKYVMSRLCKMNIRTEAVKKIQRQQIKTVEVELSNFIMDMEALINQRQREISRLLTAVVQVEMKSTYAACAEMRGHGCLQQMTKCMCDFIHRKNVQMFRSVGDSLTKELKCFQTQIWNCLELKTKSLHKSLTIQFEPLLKCMKENNVTIHELILIYRQVSEICRRSNIEFKFNDLNEEDEECLPSTSGAAKSTTCTKKIDFHEGICGMDDEDGNTFPKIYHSPTQTCHKEKNTFAAPPPLESSRSSITCKRKRSKSMDKILNLSGQERGLDSLQTPAVPSKIKTTSHGQQVSVLETCTTTCSSEDQEEANSTGGETNRQTDMHPTSIAAVPPQNKPGSSDFWKTKSKQ
ncbi:nuclear GTPase SLIP-GC-like [Protopterus annectens]|uniref:nuclear GTPase SLIP-GC-like n=1 Tax=Protopterus annectens TaxID=7888 RepID=UPI001CFA49CC|nr:nuclear GTPase SLIP-GC-like [Protopterus annectens]